VAARGQRLDRLALDDMVFRRIVLLADQQGIERLQGGHAARNWGVGRIGTRCRE